MLRPPPLTTSAGIVAAATVADPASDHLDLVRTILSRLIGGIVPIGHDNKHYKYDDDDDAKNDEYGGGSGKKVALKSNSVDDNDDDDEEGDGGDAPTTADGLRNELLPDLAQVQQRPMVGRLRHAAPTRWWRGRRALELLIIMIMYSSGDGRVHAIYQEARYHDDGGGR